MQKKLSLIVIAFLTIVLGFGCAPKAEPNTGNTREKPAAKTPVIDHSSNPLWQLEEMEIVSVSETLPPCGIMYTLVEVELRDRQGPKDDRGEVIFLPCVDVIGGPLPAVGALCTSKGEWSIIKGSTANRSMHDLPPQRLARELTCGGKTYVFDL